MQPEKIIFVFQRIYVTGVHNVTVFCSVRSFSLYERRRRKRFAAKIFSGGLNHLPSSCRPWWDRFACHGLVWTECCCCCCCRVVLLFFPPCGWEEEEAETFLQINLQKERERKKKQKNKAVVRALCDVCVRYGSEIKEPTPTPSPLLLPKQIRFLNTLALWQRVMRGSD